MNDPTPTAQAARRRTFAIISHPDAGKTTLTEKFLLYAGAIQEAGAVKAQAGRRRATSDWMALEQQRGISISSTVLQFDYRDHVVNLLDTPGHRDFSEDTYRVLAAADAAIMVLDSARGVEPQTLKLFEVCRSRRLPVLTFLNKMDRPGLEPLALLDEIEEQIGLRPTPVTWPVGDPGSFRGVIDRRSGGFVRFTRTERGSTAAGEEELDAEQAASELGTAWERALDECALLDEVGAVVDQKSFLAGESTPVFVGSAITNFGVRHLLDAIIDLAPSPAPQLDADENPRPLDSPCSGFVFKVQANMNPAHRDHVAFVRICSGHFERGMTLIHQPTSKPFATKYASSVFGAERMTVEDAWPGDVIGLVNASGLRIGDSLYLDTPVVFPRIPAFPPELIASAHSKDVSRHKQFRRGLEQLEQEGVVQVLHRVNDPQPVLAAVGQMQFEVFAHRMAHEFNAPVEMGSYSQRTVRLTDGPTAEHLKGYTVVQVLERSDGALLAMFESPYFLARMESDHPDWVLTPILTT
ncbi:peptide chain release factor 3 [Acidiferrimicrobium sp. IK]|uniref:peptide chain release factor 3 n=1 Tax=Acidiferrimicrobium sp. IK TaxID=2871700 RepID=UPI0021CB6EF3|nr:peptide chain release factor 3 [Acidiferrimicrobium sp. IK]MCU4186852.1 peptide chain release factor 3 [Acidiferrimicrobium sp. IK]